MHVAILRMERRLARNSRPVPQDLPELVQETPAGAHRLEPEDRAFWEEKGKRIANRNLWISISRLLLAFAVWMVWSVVVVNLPNVGFNYTTNQLFWLAALPGLSGRHAAHLLLVHGADLRRPALDHASAPHRC